MACCALLVGGTALDSLVRCPPSGAAGNAALDQDLVNPGSSWAAVTASTADEIVSSIQGIESAAAKITGMTAVVSGNEWRSRRGQRLEILLVAFVGKPFTATIAKSYKVAAKVAAESACEGATTDPPASMQAIASPAGYLSTCQAVHGKRLHAVVFERENVLGVVATTVAKSQLLKISRLEFKAVPSTGFTSTPGTAVPA